METCRFHMSRTDTTVDPPPVYPPLPRAVLRDDDDGRIAATLGACMAPLRSDSDYQVAELVLSGALENVLSGAVRDRHAVRGR